MININTKTKVKNVYELSLQKPDGTVQKYVSHNMVLDNYFTYLISNNAAPNLNVIRVGQGTGAVDASQVSLGSVRGSYAATVTNDSSAVPVTRVLSYTIPEGTLTGNISEIGLSNTTSGTVVYTRSLVQDAEGNPIVIVKGALDILTIRVTVYYEMVGEDLPEFIMFRPLQASRDLMLGNAVLDTSIYFFTTKVNDYIGNSIGDLTSLEQVAKAGSRVSDTENKTIRINGPIMLAAADNGSMEYPEWAAVMIGNTKFMIDVENSGMFTPYVYNNLPLGTGDGTTTAFDIPLTYFHAEDVEVKIDGVIQDTEDYVVVPQSIRRSLRSLPSADMSKVMAISPVEYTTIIPVCAGGLYYDDFSGTKTIDYDFGEPIAISHIYSKCLPHTRGTATTNVRYSWAQRARLSISEDGENWTEVVDQTGMSDSTMFSKYALPTPVTSRYVRFVVTYGRQAYGSFASATVDPLVGFGNDVLSVTFTSPPPSGSVLTAKVTSRVPIKNSNFQLGSSIQMKFERG